MPCRGGSTWRAGGATIQRVLPRRPLPQSRLQSLLVPGCCSRDYEKVFGAKTAERDARRFRRRGLRGSAKAVADLAGDVTDASVLEVGGGVGAIEVALLEAGAARATNVELAATYEGAAEKLLAERSLSDRVDRRIGDFVEESDAIEPHDVVLMHRVVCCYPDVDALVG